MKSYYIRSKIGKGLSIKGKVNIAYLFDNYARIGTCNKKICQGEHVFAGLRGPIYGGKDIDGSKIIIYQKP